MQYVYYVAYAHRGGHDCLLELALNAEITSGRAVEQLVGFIEDRHGVSQVTVLNWVLLRVEER
jgi:hypothetical protein